MIERVASGNVSTHSDDDPCVIVRFLVARDVKSWDVSGVRTTPHLFKVIFSRASHVLGRRGLHPKLFLLYKEILQRLDDFRDTSATT